MIPLNRVTILASNPRVMNFKANATITRFGLVPGALHVEVEHRTPWPMVPVSDGEAPAQTATLWVFLQIHGQWYGTGMERLRPGQIAGDDKPEGAVDDFIGRDSLYDVNRWGQMVGYVPKKGESVGFMVAAGSTRSDDNTPVEERTPVYEFMWPGSAGHSNMGAIWVEGEVEPEPEPEPGPSHEIEARLRAVEHAVAELRNALRP